jgi:hypothetical protein
VQWPGIWHDALMTASEADPDHSDVPVEHGPATSTLLRLDAEAVYWRELKGEVIAVDLRNDQYLTINASGTLLWPMLAHGTTIDQLSAALCSRWQLDRDRASHDARQFVVWLTEQHLLQSPRG